MKSHDIENINKQIIAYRSVEWFMVFAVWPVKYMDFFPLNQGLKTNLLCIGSKRKKKREKKKTFIWKKVKQKNIFFFKLHYSK